MRLKRFLTFDTASVDGRPAFACLAARFCLMDLSDFLLIVCQGELSDTARPLDVEPEWFLPPSFYAGLTAAAGEVGEVLVQLKRRSHPERPQRLHRSGP
jgi:hypothetical protein